MGAFEVVEIEVARDASTRLLQVVVGMQKDFLVLERTLDALDEHVVDAASATVHADRDARVAEHFSECVRRELRALVGIEKSRALESARAPVRAPRQRSARSNRRATASKSMSAIAVGILRAAQDVGGHARYREVSDINGCACVSTRRGVAPVPGASLQFTSDSCEVAERISLFPHQAGRSFRTHQNGSGLRTGARPRLACVQLASSSRAQSVVGIAIATVAEGR